MGELLRFTGRNEEDKVKKEKGTASPMRKEVKSNIDLDISKLDFIAESISILGKTNPKLFKDDEIDLEMNLVEEYSDYKLIMRINNCSEISIKNRPCLYMAINFEASKRNLLERYKRK